MDFSTRNSEVAHARWDNRHKIGRDSIDNFPEGLRKKALLCGFLAGDGNIQIRRIKNGFMHREVRFYPDDALMLGVYIETFNSLYKRRLTIRKKNQMFTVRCTAKAIVEDLIQYANFSMKTWNLPESLFHIEGTKEAWLRGFFSAEAYVNNVVIKVQTVNKEGMERVSELLWELGIENSLYKYEPKQVNWSTVYIIHIRKKQARERFMHNIGFYHTKKTLALIQAIYL